MNLKKIVFNHAQHVFNYLGLGHREHVYCKALQLSLNKSNIFYRSEVCCPIFFINEIVGYGRADFVIENTIIEVKSIKKTSNENFSQLQKYITSLNKVEKKKYTGFVLNFNQKNQQIEILDIPVTTSRFFQKSETKSKQEKIVKKIKLLSNT